MLLEMADLTKFLLVWLEVENLLDTTNNFDTGWVLARDPSGEFQLQDATATMGIALALRRITDPSTDSLWAHFADEFQALERRRVAIVYNVRTTLVCGGFSVLFREIGQSVHIGDSPPNHQELWPVEHARVRTHSHTK
jgi:hypothetical protein